MRTTAVLSLAAALLLVGAPLTASGPVGIYGIVEKVVFEPDEATAERIQIWGVFAYADVGAGPAAQMSAVARGYLYVALPAVSARAGGQAVTIRREWADLKSVAGTGEAVAFGEWGYTGRFESLDPRASRTSPPHIFALFARAPTDDTYTDLRVRPASEAPAGPAAYQTNAGIVKLSAQGSHAAVVRLLREALGK
jgi:hypothetical protein